MGDVRILEWDPLTCTAILASDALVWPGTRLEDPRFDAVIVREAVHVFEAGQARVTAGCAPPGQADLLAGARLIRAIQAIVAHVARPAYQQTHAYRVVQQGPDGRLTLQQVDRTDATPEFLRAVPVWPGLAGVRQAYAPGSVVLVGFVAGDATKPVVVGFAPGEQPSKTTIAAGRVEVGAGSAPAVLASAGLKKWLEDVTTYVNNLVPGTLTPPTGHVAAKLFAE